MEFREAVQNACCRQAGMDLSVSFYNSYSSFEHKNMNILIVEDELVASFMKGLEEAITTLVSWRPTAEKLAQQYRYDLFIIYIIIPGFSGIELCKKLKKQFPNVPVLMLTALGTTDDKISGFDAGADDYLVKPFEFRELLARVKVLLKRARCDTVNRLVVGDLERS
jgi:DNA-binding response OmpR family regulator